MKKIALIVFSVILTGFLYSCSDDNAGMDAENGSDVESGDTTDTDGTDLTLVEHTFTKNDGPDKNPLKGWNSSWGNDRDYATVGFQYVEWKTLEPTNNNFDFEAVERLIINRDGTKGKHLVLRLFCDWAGNNSESRGGPSWLYEEEGVARLRDNDGKYITDYNDPAYIREAIEAIEALANHYDNDPRIYSFEIGVLGYWGEWHTAGYEDYNISDESANQILNTYKNSFNRSRIMGRYPWREPLASTGNIGFHNDFFGPVGHSDEFDETILSDGKWLDGPIGGEMPPDMPASQFNEMFSTPRGMNMIETGHYATMSSDDQPCDSNPNGSNCEGFMAMHRRMGYNYQIESAIFPEVVSTSDTFSVQLTGENIGVAPMYYDWDVQFALIDEDGQPVTTFESTIDLTTIKDNDTFEFSVSNDIDDVSTGSYRVAVRIIQPEADITKSENWNLDARNVYILFSNDLPVIDGSWDDENALIGGWSILGDVTVE